MQEDTKEDRENRGSIGIYAGLWGVCQPCQEA